MLIAAVGMWRALVIESHHEVSLQQSMQGRHHKEGPGYWKKRLANLVDFPGKADVSQFILNTVYPSMQRVEQELVQQDWEATAALDQEQCRARFEVFKKGQLEFVYEVRLRAYAIPEFANPEMSRDVDGDKNYYRAEVFLRRGGRAYDVYGYDSQDVISDILDQFEQYMHFLHVSPGILPWNMEEPEEQKPQS